MLELDFAFFNLINTDKRGLAYRKFFLEKLAPIFFRPRIARLIDLADVHLKGCNIVLPLGRGNFQLLEEDKQQDLFNYSIHMSSEFNLPALAVDRRLKEQLLKLSNDFPLIFGDNFIKALACAYIKKWLGVRAIKKIIIAGETEYFMNFIEHIARFGRPVSIQNYNPTHYEILAYRLLYEKGSAVSTSYFNPASWEAGDFIIMLDPDQNQMAVHAPGSFCLKLANNYAGLAPELENSLMQSGLEAN
ncbi:MAG: hypothetical protein PHR65_03225, partial [Syntrophomonadaceae bacterium]|nr:hypothetical protein [Syntrophomonadaceae bacterium]